MARTQRTSFTLALDPGSLATLNDLAWDEAEREAEWISQRRAALLAPDMSRRQVAEVRRGIRVEVKQRRATGEFAGTRDDILARAVREELRARGMDKEWPEPPEGTTDAGGRPWGTPPSQPLGDGGYTGRLYCKLPDELATTVTRAAYWTSAPFVEALQEWADRWGYGPDVVLLEAERANLPAPLALIAAAGEVLAPQTPLQIRDELRAGILTTGDLLRAAVGRAVKDGSAELPESAGPGAGRNAGEPPAASRLA